MAGAAADTWWVAKYNNRDPTPLDGAWRVEKLEGAIDPLPAKLVLHGTWSGKPVTLQLKQDRAGP